METLREYVIGVRRSLCTIELMFVPRLSAVTQRFCKSGTRWRKELHFHGGHSIAENHSCLTDDETFQHLSGGQLPSAQPQANGVRAEGLRDAPCTCFGSPPGDTRPLPKPVVCRGRKTRKYTHHVGAASPGAPRVNLQCGRAATACNRAHRFVPPSATPQHPGTPPSQPPLSSPLLSYPLLSSPFLSSPLPLPPPLESSRAR